MYAVQYTQHHAAVRRARACLAADIVLLSTVDWLKHMHRASAIQVLIIKAWYN
jgi:hypothetical protein